MREKRHRKKEGYLPVNIAVLRRSKNKNNENSDHEWKSTKMKTNHHYVKVLYLECLELIYTQLTKCNAKQ